MLVQRQVTGTIKKANGLPWALAPVRFTPQFTINDGVTVPSAPVSVNTDSDGTFDVLLYTVDGLFVAYIGVLPSGQTTLFDLPSGADPIDLSDLLNLAPAAASAGAAALSALLDAKLDKTSVSDAAYNAASWDGNTEVPTKNAVRDLVEDTLLSARSNDYRSKMVFHHDMEEASGFQANGFFMAATAAGFNSLNPPVYANYPDSIGLITMTLNTAFNSGGGFGQGSAFSSSSTVNFGVLGNGLTKSRTRFDLMVLSSPTSTFTATNGITNSVKTVPTRGCFFRYTDAVNGGRWQAVCKDSLGETAVDTGVTATANSGMHTYEVQVNAAATEATFYIDDVLVATITTNITVADQVGGAVSFVKSAGSTAFKVCTCDYIRAEWNLTTTRT
jgi:hypothetical protein